MTVEALLSGEALLALLALTALELVLGVDNIVFIVILSGRLPAREQVSARRIGLALALIMRLALLFSITWIMGLTRPLFALFGQEFSGRGLILLLGGLFLIFKATWEIYDKVEGDPEETRRPTGGRASLVWVVAQILLLDVVFSLDSVITAVGMVDELAIMVTAMIVAVALMLLAMGPLSEFVDRHPSIKLLALAFLLLIGAMLVAEGMGQHVPKGYIYVAMAFSLFVELLNMRYRRRRGPVRLRHRYRKERSGA